MLINKWKLDPSRSALIHSQTGEIQRLGEYHFILLELLIRHAGEVLPRATLINEVWKNRVVGNNSLPTAIYALRVALGDDGRQQEIIKTVPKKGYVLNKDFIDEINDSVDNGDTLSEKKIPAPTDTNHKDDDSKIAAESSLTSDFRNRSVTKKTAMRVVFAGVVLMLAIFTLLHVFKRPTPSPPTRISNLPEHGLFLREEKVVNSDRISIFNLAQHNKETQSKQLAMAMPEAMTKIDGLLTAHKASVTIYYFNSIPKLSLDLIVTNRCQQQYQLIMGIQNWQTQATELGPLVYHEVERTLNEMPVCS